MWVLEECEVFKVLGRNDSVLLWGARHLLLSGEALPQTEGAQPVSGELKAPPALS